MLISFGFLIAIFLIVLLSSNFRSPAGVKSIAVLPLKSLTGENHDLVYELGIADSLILRLSPTKNLVVRSLSSLQQYSDDKKDSRAIGEEQKVDYVLVSNYQIVDDKIRITSQLIDVSSGLVEQVFKDDENISSRLAVQDAVAAKIGQLILKQLGRQPSTLAVKRYTNNDEAYRNYLQGMAVADKRYGDAGSRAIEYFNKAIELDPNYALAYAALANAHNELNVFDHDPHQEYIKAREAVDKALAIDGDLAEAHSYLAEMKLNYEWDFPGAEIEHKKAVELDPNSANVHRMYALFLCAMGRVDESIAESKTAIDLEPASGVNHRLYGMVLYFARHYDEAIAQLQRTIEIEPSQHAYNILIDSYRMNGDYDDAFQSSLQSPKMKRENPEKIRLLKEIYARSGWRGIFQQQIDEEKEKERNGDNRSWRLADLYTDLGDEEQAITHWEKAFNPEERGFTWTFMKVEPRNDLFRSDPRFHDLLRRIGLE